LIDSEVFLRELSKAYDGKNFVKAMQTTMEKFTGPFAFLIYSKLEDRYFAVRGHTKTLFYTNVFIDDAKVGYMINTEREDLVKNLNRVFYASHFITDYHFYFEEPVLIPENSIVELKGTYTRVIGAVVENDVEKAPAYVAPYYNQHVAPVITGTHLNKDGSYIFQPMIDFMEKSCLTLEELDIITLRTLGLSLTTMNDVDFSTFIEYILPALNANVTRRKAQTWLEMKRVSKFATFDIYNKFKVRFPYFLEKTTRLDYMLKQMKLLKKAER
jgi:glucosamine 6-phosphate synthetase-like amidotransferase/phosphosugar isomerase protein